MKRLIILFSILCTYSIIGQEKTPVSDSEVTTYYLIRHADKDLSDKTNRDPHLTKAGHDRAKHWSKVLSHVNFDMVYSTNYYRTKETATPTASKNNLEVTLYDPRNMDFKAFLETTKGKTVLVVGHSNTTPMFVNALLGKQKYAQIDESIYGNLYVVTFKGDIKVDQLLLID